MKKADLILISSAIFTGIREDTISGIVAIAGNKIQYVGGRGTMDELIGNETKIIDLGGRLIMPGFHDAHLHFYLSSLNRSPLVRDCFSCRSEVECIMQLLNLTDSVSKDRWLLGFGWYHLNWDSRELPTKLSLDAVYPDRPVCMISKELHTLWLNSTGLKKLGLSRESVPPTSGEYMRFPDGELTGVIGEAAATALFRWIFDFTQDEEEQMYENFIKYLNTLGITSVCDMSITATQGDDFVREDIFERLLSKGKLTVRINMYPTLTKDLSEVLEFRQRYTGDVLRFGGVKQFYDGVTSAHTAYMLEPYSNAQYPDDNGRPTLPDGEIRSLVLNAAQNNISVRVHTVGDRAIRNMIGYYSEANDLYRGGTRYTLEHLETMDSPDIGKMAGARIIASVQPPHMVLDTESVVKDLGNDRIRHMWPFRSMLDEGCTLAFGTDSPVVEADPLMCIYTAVTRQSAETHEPEGGWNPEERITLPEALRAYTNGSACAASKESVVGTLSKGMLADIAVLDRNILKGTPDEIFKTNVYMTIMGGSIVYLQK